nr:MAG TPA: hypothetical protein [Caudoviricetes sp.]
MVRSNACLFAGICIYLQTTSKQKDRMNTGFFSIHAVFC